MLAFGEVHKLSERNVYTDNLFFPRFCKILTKNAFLARCKKTQLLQNFCKKCERVARLLREFCKIYFQIHQSCKICIFLEEFCKSCIDCKNSARFLQKLFFLWTRERLHVQTRGAAALWHFSSTVRRKWHKNEIAEMFKKSFGTLERRKTPAEVSKYNFRQKNCYSQNWFSEQFLTDFILKIWKFNALFGLWTKKIRLSGRYSLKMIFTRPDGHFQRNSFLKIFKIFEYFSDLAINC